MTKNLKSRGRISDSKIISVSAPSDGNLGNPWDLKNLSFLKLYPSTQKLSVHLNKLIIQKHFMVFRLELEEAKKHKSNQMEYDALARIINKNKDRKTTQGKSPILLDHPSPQWTVPVRSGPSQSAVDRLR